MAHKIYQNLAHLDNFPSDLNYTGTYVLGLSVLFSLCIDRGIDIVQSLHIMHVMDFGQVVNL